jgi:hypothetical protein
VKYCGRFLSRRIDHFFIRQRDRFAHTHNPGDAGQQNEAVSLFYIMVGPDTEAPAAFRY